jgi:hypothetical protein
MTTFQVGRKTSKYGNAKTVYNGVRYDSKKEANRASELDLLARAGVIKNWEGQVKLPIQHKGVKICTYIADFKVVYPDAIVEYEDVKGFRTAIYRLKKKLVKAFYNIEIKEI